jgi:hypothetical protein
MFTNIYALALEGGHTSEALPSAQHVTTESPESGIVAT